jgi:NADH-quinone oxidoreductase subunit G
VLRVLGNLLGLSGFDFETTEQVRHEALGDEARIQALLSNDVVVTPKAGAAPHALQRLADVPIYAADALVRRATSLQLTTDARAPQAGLAPWLWAALGLQPGDRVKVSQGAGFAVLPARLEPTLAEGTVRVPAGHADTAGLGAMTGELSVERVASSAQAVHAQESGVAA